MFPGIAFTVRSVVGGAFMGLANLVPGISGGTMLLAVGIYPQFISGVAEVSTLRFRPRVVFTLACVAGAAALALAGGARLIGVLLDRFPWAMYSLFIGLTLGGVPLLWRRLRPASGSVALSATVAVALMALLAVFDPDRIGDGATSGVGASVMLVVAGASGGAAMIVPGVSGAYLLLVLGQYRRIVDAVAGAADAARAAEWAPLAETLHVLAPVALGVTLGVVVVSNLVKAMLEKHERATLGFMLGLLLGAVLGLWPFTEAVPPRMGDVVRGQVLATPEMVAAVDPEHYGRVLVLPSPGEAAAGAVLTLAGFRVSWGISRLGYARKPDTAVASASTPRPTGDTPDSRR